MVTGLIPLAYVIKPLRVALHCSEASDPALISEIPEYNRDLWTFTAQRTYMPLIQLQVPDKPRRPFIPRIGLQIGQFGQGDRSARRVYRHLHSGKRGGQIQPKSLGRGLSARPKGQQGQRAFSG
jgi:hypothetical protein